MVNKDSEVSAMNLSQIKAFLGEKPQHLGKENSIQNQLRDTGLKQSVSGQNNSASQKLDQFSSSTSLGVRIYSNALNNTLQVDNQKPDLPASDPVDPDTSLFDFEKVAKNVLNFIAGAIKNAQNRGANNEELSTLFDQASSGVLRGIKLAEKDLAGFMNEEIANGISQSKNTVDGGIANLKRNIFNPEIAEPKQSSQSTVNSIYASSLKQEHAELKIRTRDGDTVNIIFEDFKHAESNQLQVQSLSQPINLGNVSTKSIAPVSVPVNEALAKPNVNPEHEQAKQSDTQITEQNVVFYQESSFSFSVKGELDLDELKAIGQLVSDANTLAEEFFNGDIETAFNQALELGFDEQELSSFALQLTKVENTQVIKAYETVSRFDQDSVDSDPAKAVKPITDYLDKLLTVLEGSKLQLEDNKFYENVINELINRLGQDVATPDLISAINRFNEFNHKLVNNLPMGYQPKNQY